MPLTPHNFHRGDPYAEIPPPEVVCECCGARGTTSTMVNQKISVGCPGHPSIPAIYCDATQGPNAYGHWTCPNQTCFLSVLVACGKEHIVELIKAAHIQLGVDATWQQNT